MNIRRRIGCVVLAAALAVPVAATAQSVNVTRSILEDQPFTLIYPETMVASGTAGEPLTINHPNAPLQCTLVIVPVEETDWTPQRALAEFDDEAVTAQWEDSFPDFVLGERSTASYQSGQALLYEGTSAVSPLGMPITLVHTETVDSGRGYILDCLYATDIAANARPIVDFIIANFSTRADAECCIGAQPVEEQELVAPE